MPGPFDVKYTDTQRAALIAARLDLRVGTYEKIVRMAAAGTLLREGSASETLPPFDVNPRTLASICRRAQRDRNPTDVAGVTDAAARDTVESLRIRLTAVCHRELLRIETIQRRSKPREREVSGATIRDLARAIRELAAIPGRDEPRAAPVGTAPTASGKREDPRTRGGLAADLLRDAQRAPNPHTHTRTHIGAAETAPHPDTPTHTPLGGDNPQPQHTNTNEPQHDHTLPGSLALQRLAREQRAATSSTGHDAHLET